MLTTKQKITIAIILQSVVMFCRRLAGKGPFIQVKRYRIQWALDLREGIDFAIWLTGAFEPLTIREYRKLIRPGNIVLDIGANIGAHTLHLAQAVGPLGMVHAFEPTDAAFAKLKNNLDLNPELKTRVHCHQLMLLDHCEEAPHAPIYASWPLTNAPDLHPLHHARLMTADHAQTSTLDLFLDTSNIQHVDFVKIDIDGFESRMLRGASRMLQLWRPLMIIELAPHQLDEFGTSIEELVQLLADAHYELQDVSSGVSLALDGSILRKVIKWGGSRNAIARPKTV